VVIESVFDEVTSAHAVQKPKIDGLGFLAVLFRHIFYLFPHHSSCCEGVDVLIFLVRLNHSWLHRQGRSHPQLNLRVVSCNQALTWWSRNDGANVIITRDLMERHTPTLCACVRHQVLTAKLPCDGAATCFALRKVIAGSEPIFRREQLSPGTKITPHVFSGLTVFENRPNDNWGVLLQ